MVHLHEINSWIHRAILGGTHDALYRSERRDSRMRACYTVASFALAGCLVGDAAEFNSEGRPAGDPDPTGFGDTYFASGSLDTSNPFFKSLGTNGRACVSCHMQDEGWTITPAAVRARFD